MPENRQDRGDNSSETEEKEDNSIKFPHGKLFIVVTIIAIAIGVALGIILR